MNRNVLADARRYRGSWRVGLATLLVGLVVVACSSGADVDLGTSATEPATTAEPTSPQPAPDGGMEFNTEGLIPIPPGSGTTRVFVPSFTYTVPPGWYTTGENIDAINVLQQLEPSARLIAVRRLGEETAEEVVARLAAEPAWATEHGVIDTTLGNLAAKQLDGVATDKFTLYAELTGRALIAEPGDRLRVLLTSVDEWTVMVLVAASVGEFDAFAAEASTLIDTIRFVPAQEPGA